MAAKKNTVALVPVTGSVTPELRAAIEDVRWDRRQTVSDIVREALEEWAVAHAVKVGAPAPEQVETLDEATVVPTPSKGAPKA